MFGYPEAETPQGAFARVSVGLYRLSGPEWRVEFISAGVERLFGMPAGELRGVSRAALMQRFVHAEDRARVDAAFARALAEGADYASEFRVLHTDGSWRWVADQGGLLRDAAGRVVAIEGALSDITERRLAEQFQAGQTEVLELLSTGAMLHEVTGALARMLERQLTGVHCLIVELNDEARLETLAAPTLAPAYTASIDGVAIGPSVGSCGTACWRGEPVVVADIDADPLWAPWREIALAHGLRACWSQPIMSVGGEVLGSLSFYAEAARAPGAREHELMRVGARLAAIAIENSRTDQMLREQAQRLTLVFQQFAIGMVELDVAGHFLRTNRKFCEIVGYGEPELLGRSFTELLHPDDRDPSADGQFALVSGSAQVQHTELRYLRRNGETAWASVWASALRDPGGKPKSVIVAVDDVTERRALARTMRQLNADLERRVKDRTAALESSNRELESFSYSVSHDLRAPLRALDGFALLLHDEYGAKLDAMGLQYLERIRNASQRMGALIDDLLELARISRCEFEAAEVDLGGIARTVAAEISAEAPARPVKWEIAGEVQVRGDALMLKTVLENLLRNAWKFTRERDCARISLTAERRGREIVVSVHDNGVGFDMKYADKLFVPFQRLHAPSRYEGTGVGLAIVRRVIERHGGRVWGEAKPGEGACFSFTLLA